MNSIDSAKRTPGLQVTGDPIRHAGPPDLVRRPGPPQAPPVPEPVAGADELGHGRMARFLAEVAIHEKTDTPFCIGLFGAAGSGKSFVLDRMMRTVGEIAAMARPFGLSSVFVGDVVSVRVDGARAADPAVLLAEAVFEGLADSHPQLAADLLHAGGDPAQIAREADEALNESSRRLETERQTLNVLSAREARQIETALDAPGSRVDAYARAHRSRIERALRPLGFTAGDPVAAYKELVREAAESGGWMSRAGLGLRSLWAYRGQARLIVWAIVFALLAWGIATLDANQDNLTASLRTSSDKAAPVADWLQAHAVWLGPLHTLASALAVLALLWTVVRALRVLQPIFKGLDLLRHDLDERRRDLKGLLAHQTRRVDGLVAAVAAHSRRVGEVDRRARLRRPAGPGRLRLASGDATLDAARDQAAAFFKELHAAMTDRASVEADELQEVPPRRIVVAIDDLEARPGEAAAALLEAARRLFGQGFVTVVAASRSHLADGFSATDPAYVAAQFARCIQLPYRVDPVAAEGALASLATRLMSITAARSAQAAVASIDPQWSALDRPWGPREAQTVTALAPFAGETPRAVKQFVTLYRVVRADPQMRDAAPPVLTILALALALDAQGRQDSLTDLARVSRGEEAGLDPAVLRRVLAATREASGEPVDFEQAQRALDVAGRYTRHASATL